ncbi:MAG: SAM-dependent methyltransferase [Opitutales bacterium]|nr:SAM-dependent methyltransferase [Opitutales bacterium]
MEPTAPPRPVSPAMRDALRERVDVRGRMRFDAFVETVLYHPELGYYRHRSPRVGRGADTDFYTSESLGPVFGRLIAEAAEALLPPALPLKKTIFLEIGAEAGRHVLDGVDHRFSGTMTVAVGTPLEIPKRAVVFSNELFDAQPFRRFVRTDSGWRERGVVLMEGGVAECLLTPGGPTPDGLPDEAPAGYCVDLPTGAVALAESIAARPWSGLFLAIDYGKTRRALFTEHPEGTARAYHRHRQESDLLARAGQQDLTCHICWDDLEDALRAHRFDHLRLERQEAFLMRHAHAAVQAILSGDTGGVGAARRKVMELIHPQYFGARFQVLSALRTPPDTLRKTVDPAHPAACA